MSNPSLPKSDDEKLINFIKGLKLGSNEGTLRALIVNYSDFKKSQALENQRAELREDVEGMKMNVDEETINYYEDEDVAIRTLAHNRAYNQALDNVLQLLTKKE